MGKDRKTKKGNREDELDDESSTISDQTTKSKNKKGKRGNDEDTWDDVLEQTKQTHVDKDSKDVAGRKKKDKKKVKSQSISDDDESIPTKLGSSDEESVKPKKNQKKKEKKKFDDDDDEDDEVDVILANRMKKVEVSKPKVKKPQVKSVFEFLNDEGMDLDDDDSGDDKQSENDIEIEFEKSLAEVGRKKEDKGKKGKKEKKRKEADEEFERMVAEIEMADSKKGKSKQKEVRDDFEDKMATVVTEISEEDDDKKGKKKKKKKREDDEEILDEIEDKMATVVTEIPEEDDDKKGKKKKKKKREEDEEGEDIEEKMAVVVTEIPDDEDDKKSKKKKKKMKDDEGVDDENKDLNEGEDGDEGGTIKTAAQKKKEKKERERLKKIALKAQDKGKKKVDIQDKPLEGKGDGANEMKDDEDYAVKDDDELEDGGKKKKDKGKKKKDEKEEKDKKRPGKKQILAMQEALKKLKEEEDKARLEEEERQKAAEEAENLRLEKLRLEQERKERKKQKEKEKRERLKAEGKLLTQAQKQQRARAQAMLEALRAQGLDVPKIGEKKERTPRPGDRIRPKKVKPISATEDESKVDVSIEPKLELSSESIAVSLEGKTPRDDDQSLLQSPEEEIKESWDQASNDDVKDSWDISSSEDESGKPERKDGTHKKTMAKKKPVSDESSGESESESDESESESEDESSSEESESEDEEEAHKPTSEKLRERAEKRIEKRKEENEKNRSTAKLRSPVVCVLGHVDTGKTKILDKIRHTHVQDSEAGGITQQIGATMVPMEAIREQSKMAKNFMNFESIIPGLLIIDTPGHESFSNLRSRGSSLCDIAILVVDIMHGLEPQTLESIKLLRAKKTPFVVALNKIDRLYEWKPNKHKDVQDTLKSQNRNTQLEFEERVKSTVTQFAEQSLNVKLFYENNDPRIFISLVPTSAHTGDGMGNLMALIVELTQNMMSKQISYSDELQATVLEVKAVPGLGTTIDVILVNGRVREGDTIILAGTDGPLVTQIRSLLMPQPLKELRVKNPYQEFKEVEAAQGIKVTGKDLDRAIAGLNLLVAHHPDEVEICKEEVAKELQAAMNSIKLSERGVYVQASTLGSLEALIEFLRSSSIPYSGVRIGPVVKKDVMKASVMLEHDSQYAVILAFDVKIERDAQELADSLGVKIFSADIIYHLFDKFTSYRDELKRKKRDQFKHIAVFPCKLRILPQFVYNTRDPIVIGVSVEAGVVKEGTPLCVPSRDFLDIGIVTTIQLNHKSMDSARKGQEVCIKIEPNSGETPKLYGRHFEHTDPLVSKITRQSIDACKEHFRDDLQKTDWQLMVELKKAFQIV